MLKLTQVILVERGIALLNRQRNRDSLQGRHAKYGYKDDRGDINRKGRCWRDSILDECPFS